MITDVLMVLCILQNLYHIFILLYSLNQQTNHLQTEIYTFLFVFCLRFVGLANIRFKKTACNQSPNWTKTTCKSSFVFVNWEKDSNILSIPLTPLTAHNEALWPQITNFGVYLYELLITKCLCALITFLPSVRQKKIIPITILKGGLFIMRRAGRGGRWHCTVFHDLASSLVWPVIHFHKEKVEDLEGYHRLQYIPS